MDVFVMPPAPARSLWMLAAIGALMLGLLLLFGWFAIASRGTRYEVTADGLAIRGTMYGRSIPWASMETDGVRAVDLRDERELQPTLRTNGIGLPGYQAGWFRLRRAGKGLVFLTDRSRVVAIPTRLGYTVLLSTSEPERLVQALRRGHARAS